MPTVRPDLRRLAAVLCSLALACGAVACSSGTDDAGRPARRTQEPTPARQQEPATGQAHVSGQRAFSVPADIADRLQHLLDRRADALLEHDADAFAEDVGGGSGFRAAQATYFANLEQLPVEELGYELDPATLVRKGDGYWAQVEVSLGLTGFDSRNVVTPDRYRFSRHHRRFVLTSVRDPQWERRHEVSSQPWDDEAVVVRRRGSRVLGVFDAPTVGFAAPVMRAAARGINQVRAIVPQEWDGRVVVYAVADDRFRAGLPAPPGGDPATVDALTVPVLAGPGSRQVAGMRIVLDPGVLGKDPAELGRLVRHELTHVAMGEQDPGLPVWLSEGLAEWVSVQPIPPEDRVVPRAALAAARNGVDHLPDDQTFNGPDAQANYGISWWACEAVVDGYGEKVLWSLPEELATTDHPDAGLQDLLGTSEQQLARKASRLMLATYDPPGRHKHDRRDHHRRDQRRQHRDDEQGGR